MTYSEKLQYAIGIIKVKDSHEQLSRFKDVCADHKLNEAERFLLARHVGILVAQERTQER